MVTLGRARWLSGLLIAPVLVCAVAASTYFGQRCRFTGMVTLDSCCPKAADEAVDDDAEDDARAAPEATLSDPGCCERLLITVAKVSGDTSEYAFEGPVRSVTSLVSTPVAARLLSPASVTRVRRPEEPPGVAPPAFLLRHSFLI